MYVADSVALCGATKIHNRWDQLGHRKVEATYKLANILIHVERVICAMRQHFQVRSTTADYRRKCTPKI